MPSITYFEEDIKFKLKQKESIRGWIVNTINTEGYKLKSLSFIFCSDNYLLQINQQYLNHDTFTDIITFDNSDQGGLVMGDIFISVDRIRENATQLQITETDEMHRVMIHGVLHLLGYKDKNVDDKKKMTQKEDFYLQQRAFNQ